MSMLSVNDNKGAVICRKKEKGKEKQRKHNKIKIKAVKHFYFPYQLQL